MSVQNLQQANSINLNYDKAHDILYLYFGEPTVSYSDETAPGVYIRFSEKDKTITGVIILDYKKKSEGFIKSHVPVNIDFEKINRLIH